MSDRLLVSTRKGLFVFAAKGDAWEIERHAFLGENVTLALADARDGHWYAVLNLGHFGVKLHRSADLGRSWTEIAVPAYAEGDTCATGDGKPPAPAKLQLLWSLACGGAGEPGRLWAGTIPGGLFRPTTAATAGSSCARCGTARNARSGSAAATTRRASIPSASIRATRACCAWRSPCGGVWHSADSGASWNVTTRGMFAAYMPPERREDPAIQDPHRLVQCAHAPDHLWVQHHNGVFRSVDGGRQWHEVADVPPSVFGFAVAVHPRDPATAWFVPALKDECRVPVDGRLVVARTRDGGASFELLRDGLPSHAYDLVYRHGLAVDDSGDRLAFGSTTGGLWTSPDQGERWQASQTRLPPVHAVAFARAAA